MRFKNLSKANCPQVDLLREKDFMSFKNFKIL